MLLCFPAVAPIGDIGATIVHHGRHFAAEAAGACRLLQYDETAGFADRSQHRLLVQGRQGAQRGSGTLLQGSGPARSKTSCL